VTTAERLLLDVDGAPLSLVCSECGYGIARPTPPGPCPMCGTSDAWAHSPWRPFGRPPSTLLGAPE